MNGFVRVIALLPGLILTTELLNRAGADWFGAYTAAVLTVCLSGLLSERFIIAPECALTAEFVFSSVFIMGLGHGAAKVILLLGALLALPLGRLLTRCTLRFRRLIFSAAPLGLSLMMLAIGMSQGGLIRPAVMTHSQLGNLLSPDVLVTLLTLLVMGGLAVGKSSRRYTLVGGLLFAVLLAAGEGFLDFDNGLFAVPSVEDLGKVWFAFDFPAAWGILLTTPGDILLPAATIAIAMVSMTASVCAVAEGQEIDSSEECGLNKKSSLLGIISACLGSGSVTVSPVSLLETGAKAETECGRRYGMAAAGVLLLFCAPFAKGVTDCPGIIAPFYLWLGGIMTARCLVRLADMKSEASIPEGVITVAAAVLAALSYNLTAGIGTALVCYIVLQLLSGQGRGITAVEWLITGCYILYFSSFCF